MIQSLLIANRGEIARRITRTARAMGIRVIAVFSDEDADAPHVEEADEAVRLGPAAPRESYLNVEAVLDAARQTVAEAIHPGYGFLSENADFAEACQRAGIIFVGPPASAIRSMGRKDEAKKIMDAAGVPITPGYMGDDQSDGTLQSEADRLGYPLLIKAVSGGGGKGMRRVGAANEFKDALDAARREASSAFGDDRVLLEKFIENPRHIEVQVLADKRGRAIHLFERDCSLQRRHQKVIEEAPAPGISPEVRAAICSAAVDAAKAVGYENAGTVEFIADGSGELRADGFWFMEMNTRLQVEHPVTEEVTGLDLVELQLRIASGGSAPDQGGIGLIGHAVEARLYAEDPASGFLPSTGDLRWLSLPDGEDVRVDSGVEPGGRVSLHYDPMIAKLIVHDATRAGALSKLTRAVEAVETLGVKTNAGFLARLLRRPEFRAGAVDTGFIAQHSDALTHPTAIHDEAEPLAAALMLDREEERAQDIAALAGEPNSPWSQLNGFRLNLKPRLSPAFLFDGERREIPLVRTARGFEYHKGEATVRVEIDRDGDAFEGRLGRERVSGHAFFDESGLTLMFRGETLSFPVPRPEAEDAMEAEGEVKAPMPGKVLDVRVENGQGVSKGETLVILEAMKMEQALAAPRDGVVKAVKAATGDQVSEGDVLIVLAEEAEDAA